MDPSAQSAGLKMAVSNSFLTKRMPRNFVVAARIGTEWVEVLRKSDVTDWTTETFVLCLLFVCAAATYPSE